MVPEMPDPPSKPAYNDMHQDQGRMAIWGGPNTSDLEQQLGAKAVEDLMQTREFLFGLGLKGEVPSEPAGSSSTTAPMAEQKPAFFEPVEPAYLVQHVTRYVLQVPDLTYNEDRIYQDQRKRSIARKNPTDGSAPKPKRGSVPAPPWLTEHQAQWDQLHTFIRRSVKAQKKDAELVWHNAEQCWWLTYLQNRYNSVPKGTKWDNCYARMVIGMVMVIHTYLGTGKVQE